jgi:hypothetical protein
MSETDERTQAIAEYINKKLHTENVATKLWSFVHHGTLFGAAALSAAAALVLQLKTCLPLNPGKCSDLATVLSASASLIGVISASGAFGAKWRANRATKGKLNELQLEMMKEAPDVNAVIEQLKSMWRLHNSRISADPDQFSMHVSETHPRSAKPQDNQSD